MENPLINFIRKHHALTESEANSITKHVETRRAIEGEVLLEIGQYAREMFFVCEGVLKIGSINSKGDRVTQFFIRENYFCTILNSFNNNVAGEESIVAACDVELIVLSKNNLAKIYAEVPWFQSWLDGITKQALIDKIMARNKYLGEDAATRYQQFLTYLPDVAMRVSLTDIASYLEITPQSLSRIRRAIK